MPVELADESQAGKAPEQELENHAAGSGVQVGVGAGGRQAEGETRQAAAAHRRTQASFAWDFLPSVPMTSHRNPPPNMTRTETIVKELTRNRHKPADRRRLAPRTRMCMLAIGGAAS